MIYQIKASSTSNQDAVVQIKESYIVFGTTIQASETLTIKNWIQIYLERVLKNLAESTIL